VLAACDAALHAADEDLRVERTSARRLVGRLCNLSQVAPELGPLLHGGYAVTEASWVAGGRRRLELDLTLRRGGTVHIDWTCLLTVAAEVLERNEGVAMAPRRVFPGRLRRGSLTSVTDASGDDGVGGYAFLAEAPGRVFVASEEWPDDVRSALAASADEHQAELRRSGISAAAPSLSMPAAELFGLITLPRMVARVVSVSRVFAVGDCAPAAGAVNALVSGNAQMRRLLDAARESGLEWLGVAVPREANQDADLLSHPERADEVIAGAEATGLAVVRLRPQEEDWQLLRAAIAEGAARRVRRRRRKRERPQSSAGGGSA
jgi:hypothetical protein